MLDDSQAGIKIAGRNINYLQYADVPSLWQKFKEASRKQRRTKEPLD